MASFSFAPPANSAIPFPSEPSVQNHKRKRSSQPSGSSDAPPPDAPQQRTQKRWRNNRPPEEMVHQYTLHKLFSAQQHTSAPPQPSPFNFATVQRNLPGIQRPPVPNAFALLGQGRSGNVQAPAPATSARCEDCEREFAVVLTGEELCLGCRRTVCDLGCSASNGEGRVCLMCACNGLARV